MAPNVGTLSLSPSLLSPVFVPHQISRSHKQNKWHEPTQQAAAGAPVPLQAVQIFVDTTLDRQPASYGKYA